MRRSIVTPRLFSAGMVGLKVFCAICLSILLAACSALPPGSTPTAEARLGPPLETFHLRGRAMLRQDQRIDHFRFDWQHSLELDDLLITSPFGQGVGKVRRDATGASLRLADGRIEHAETLQTLTQRLFGTAIPLHELADWLRGARPQKTGTADGWSIDVEQVDTVSDPDPAVVRSLPRIQVMRSEDRLLRLVVDERETTQ